MYPLAIWDVCFKMSTHTQSSPHTDTVFTFLNFRFAHHHEHIAPPALKKAAKNIELALLAFKMITVSCHHHHHPNQHPSRCVSQACDPLDHMSWPTLVGWVENPGRSEYIQSVSIIHACIIVCQCMLGILISILFHKCIHAYMIFSNHDFSISSFWFGSIVFYVSLNSFPQTWNIAASIFIMNLKSWWSSSSAPLSSSTPPSSSSSSPDCCLDAPTLHHGLSMHMCCHHLLPFVPCATHRNIPQLTNIDNGVFNRGFDINLWFFRKMWVSKPAKDIPSQKEDLRADAREHEYWPKMAATIRRSRFILFQYPPKKKVPNRSYHTQCF